MAPAFTLPTARAFESIRGISRRDLATEALAGVTLAALMVPLNIGYAQVAGLPPTVGLYTSIAPMIAFAVFASSRQLIAGPDAPIAALIGSLLASMAATSDPRYVQLAYAQGLVCAVIFLALWLFRLGFLANFLSRAVMIGFVTGLGIEILTSQVEKILAVSVEADGWFREVTELIGAIPDANMYSVGVGLTTIALIRVARRVVPALPGPLVALVLMTAAVELFALQEHGVTVLGAVPSGLPSLTVPDVGLSDYLDLIPGALAICGVTLADSVLVGRKYAQQHRETFDADQQMLALGAANVAGALTGGFVTGSSASRTAAMATTGARTQLPSIVGAVIVAVVLIAFTDLLAMLPNTVLAAIILDAILSLIEVGELRELFRVRRSEFVIALSCVVTVLAVGSLAAVIVAFLLSTIDIVRRAAEPSISELHQSPDRTGFFVTSAAEGAPSVPGLLIVRFGGPLFFGNAETFHQRIAERVEGASPHLEWLVLDMEAVTDIDTTGSGALRELLDVLREQHVEFAISRANAPIPELLRRYGLLEAIGEQRMFLTNRDAAEAYFRARGLHPPEAMASLG